MSRFIVNVVVIIFFFKWRVYIKIVKLSNLNIMDGIFVNVWLLIFIIFLNIDFFVYCFK